MSEQRTPVEQLLHDVDTGAASTLDRHLADNYNDHNPAPFASKTPGLAGMRETYNIALGIFAEFKHVVEDTFTDGDRVVSRIVGSGRHVGPLLGIPATQKMVTMGGIAIHRVAGGKLVEHWGQVDGVGLLTQIGAIPAPPPAPPAVRDASFRKSADAAAVRPEEMTRLIRTFFDEVLNGRNQSAIGSVLHPQYINHSFQTGAAGPDGLMRAVGMFTTAFPDMHLTVEDVVATAGKAATRGYFTGTHKGTFLNIPATGTTVKVPYIDIWHGYEGRLFDNWVNMDLVGALVQLGAIPAPQG
jgi:predicted ester cyclase